MVGQQTVAPQCGAPCEEAQAKVALPRSVPGPKESSRVWFSVSG